MKKKYKSYNIYKDSGVEWLGKMPDDWTVKSAKWLFKKEQRPVSDHDDIITAFRDGQVTLRNLRRTIGFTNALKEHGYQGVRKGDLVIHAMDAFAGAIGVSDSDGKSTPVYSVCTPKEVGKVDTKYYAHLLRVMSQRNYILALAKGIRERSTDFRFDMFANLKLPIPPLKTQQKIASFLDHETGKIDTLIEKQTKLIELLEEKRKSVISHAVTKGIDPNAKMKDSGVEWLGDIPENWKVVKIRRIITEHRQGFYTSEDYVDNGIKLMRITDFRANGKIDYKSSPSVSKNRNLIPYLVRKGDFLFARTGGAGSFGMVHETPSELVAYASYLIRFRFDVLKVYPLFLKYYFLSQTFIDGIKKNIHGGVNQNIHAEDIKTQFCMIPPIEAQQNIALFLDNETAKIDKLISKAKEGVELLKERRTALISSAVTGKIDVSDWNPPEMQSVA